MIFMDAWNGWYHVNSNTYGTWLRGDRRGWRARHHREHVDGDYRCPPPGGAHEWVYRQSRRLMKSDPVRLSAAHRRIAAAAIAEKLLEVGMEVLAVSVGAVHYHLLGRFRDGDVRGPVGRAKKHAWHELVKAGFVGKAWAKRCRALPVADRAHQVNAFNYIVAHAGKGAWVWTFREGLVPPG